jgi:hypothetical protein
MSHSLQRLEVPGEPVVHAGEQLDQDQAHGPHSILRPAAELE